VVEVGVAVRAKRAILASFVLGLVLAAAGAYFAVRPSADRRAFGALSMEWNHAGPGVDRATQERLAERCLDLSRRYPGTTGGVAALLLAAVNAPDTAAGEDAARQFAELIQTADLDRLGAVFEYVGGRKRVVSRFGPALLARIHRTPDHPRCGGLLTACCVLSAPEDDGVPSEIFQEAADLIAERYAANPEIQNFCELLGRPSGSPGWAVRYERHLRAILEANQDRKVRCAALHALASVVMIAGEDRQPEAEALFERFCSEFDGTYEYRYQNIEQVYRHEAQIQLKELKFRAAGKPAPEIEGLDLDGRSIRLSDYRGRAVLLNFWGTWCFPCMKLVPHERELATAFQGRPFAIVGVNCDDEVEKARAAATRTGMTWPSFRNEAAGRPAITKEWKLLGFPTLYLIDHHGTIRKRWVGSPPSDELRRVVEVLVRAAEKRVSADAMKPVIAALSAQPVASRPASPSPGPAYELPPGTGFSDKVYRDRDGSEAKYVVFVPPSYDGTKPVPAILSLHGSGPRGTDGRAHVQRGLAEAIRARGLEFPFLVVFPQARTGEDWQAGTPSARRALAILERVQADYRVDPDRVALTGVSMGGAGTWSLAAAEPQRWSAIVPLCHGGDTRGASRLAGIPCWCFHGAADAMIPPQQSRDMVEAITKAGGRPLYQELPGVGHNDLAARVYAMDDLLEWLLAQDRSRRGRTP
jgi:poly(3-hydroxybutyrate) depolymerase/thiol-disulfide isomerase/thioredoxin